MQKQIECPWLKNNKVSFKNNVPKHYFNEKYDNYGFISLE